MRIEAYPIETVELTSLIGIVLAWAVKLVIIAGIIYLIEGGNCTYDPGSDVIYCDTGEQFDELI